MSRTPWSRRTSRCTTPRSVRPDGARSGRIEQADDHPDRRPRSTQSIGRSIRVLHCDDSAPYRRLVSEMLVVQPDLEVVGQAHDGESLLETVAACDPDLVLLDASVAGLDGGLLARLRATAPHVRIVVLSGMAPEASALPGSRMRSCASPRRSTISARSSERPSRASCPACSWSGRPGRAGRAGADRDRPSTRGGGRDAGLERQ